MKVYKHPDYSYIDIVEIPVNEIENIDIDICQQPRETLGHYYNRMEKKPEVLINAGFFNTKTYEACFSMIEDSQELVNHYGVKAGIGTLVGALNKFTYGTIDDGQDWNDFIAGYPVLVNDGKVLSSVSWGSEINYNALRSCVGYNADTVFVVTVSKPGMRFEPLAKIMMKLGCTYAINLDGGGSSRMLVNGDIVNTPTENRSVDSVLAIYLKEEEVKAEEAEFQPYIEHVVVKGDSMWKIATYYLGKGTRYPEIMAFNDLTSAVLRVGQVLKIPADCEKYTVVKGDSLWKIAANKLGSGLKYKELAAFNNIDPNDPIQIGQIIYIPV